MKADDFIAGADNGTLRDMKSLTCAFWFALHRDELRRGGIRSLTLPSVKKISNVLGNKPLSVAGGLKTGVFLSLDLCSMGV